MTVHTDRATAANGQCIRQLWPDCRGQDRTTPCPHFGTPSNIHHFRHFTFHILVPVLYLHLRSWTKENGGVVLKIVKLIFVFCHVPPSRMCASHALFRPTTNLFDALFSRRHTQAHST